MRKGVSLAGLIIYIIGLSAILGIVAAFNINIMDASNDFVAISKINEQYTKFNMFFLSTTKQAATASVTNTAVMIDGKSYSYNSQDKTIEYSDGDNNNIVVCKYVDNVVFSNVNNTLCVDISFKIKDVVYSPESVKYVIGRGY